VTLPSTIAIGDDLVVHRLGFGTMSLTGAGVWGEPRDPAEARRVLRRAIELGVDFLDAADSYGPDVSERLIAEALHPYPAHLVVATKGGLTRQGPGRWARNGRPEHLRAACEGSLRRLRLDRIDLYQLHAVDPAVPLEESLGALVDLRDEGKVRHIGICNVALSQLECALATAPIVSAQNRFSLADRASEPLLEWCEQRQLAFIAWAPLAKGSLSRRHGRLNEIAARRQATTCQLGLAWLLHQSSTVVAIPGTSSLAHVEENCAAGAIPLGNDDLAALAGLSLRSPRPRRALQRARRGLARLRGPFLGSSK
jgi:aryl-alcohol dehydrogenase-like predicted oxidoreductase